MYEERITLLLTRKIAGEATADELRELNDLLHKHHDAVYYEEFLKELWHPSADTAQQADKINSQYEKHIARFKDELDFTSPENDGLISPPDRGSLRLKLVLLILPLLLVIGLMLQKVYRAPSNKAFTTIMAGKGMRKQFQLPDGTRVWLNSESQLSYEGDMLNKETRTVKLVGEAYFDVTHNKQHPFIVNTDKISIKVLGTAFNVEAYPNAEKSTTTLIRGSIELSVNNVNYSKIKLKPSEKFDLIEQKVPAKQAAADPDPVRNLTIRLGNITPLQVGDEQYTTETSWKENRLIIQDETFEELVPRLEKWYGIQIKVSDSKVLAYRFTGVFTNEKLGEALKAMQTIKQFNFKIDNNDVTIY
ncbi:hypothetical protein GCM10023149_01990 [Mucilaginibacter gynuensis]|uniref:FecR family protein n=1 Tax=Mucilaginibacter gynuensis TaxID=1302236 RepID=A0ABP8FPB0_9SPHI